MMSPFRPVEMEKIHGGANSYYKMPENFLIENVENCQNYVILVKAGNVNPQHL